MYKGRFVTLIIAAGGLGARYGAGAPKQFLRINGKSMVCASAEPFIRGRYIDLIVITVPDGYVDHCRDLIIRELGAVWTDDDAAKRLAVKSDERAIPVYVVCGGADRPASVRAGLAAAEAAGAGEGGLVLIHDAARPFVTDKLVERVLEAAYTNGAAVPVHTIRDTVYVMDENGFALDCISRERLRAAQTPQGFDAALIKEAHALALEKGLSPTDDGMPVLFGGKKVELVPGEGENIKITTPEDIGPGPASAAGKGLRVGIGFDAHRFTDERPLVIGGVEIPFEKGLLGHSDADVLIHALMDAILGALHEGDIGTLFPDSDPAYAGISSMKLLGEVVALMKSSGYEIVNTDMTIVAEKPRMAGYRESIECSLAAVLETKQDSVSLKATTTEKLGFTGREEGIAAEAIVLLRTKENEG